MGSVGAVLLAAGLSERMGTLKPLLPWRGQTLLIHQVDTLRLAGLDPVVVVLGHRAHELELLLSGVKGVRQVLNPRYREGKTTSLKAGLRTLDPARVDAALLLNVDQPRTAETVSAVVAAHLRSGALITVPSHGGKGGHPIILSMKLLDEALSVTEADEGLKALVRRHKCAAHRVAMPTAEVLLDLNTVDDYQRAVGRWGELPGNGQ